ncbi:hypothetical protein DFH08DRAFT_802352 [Mycena albidolilacea]|uniref:Uncharacterized protein n=1 Tax=Mycena albidolilacea TaxID=1033008 RepID=A0AAD7AH65_9AGAR|nr:hypothetical protein DFH08DRAFT_802352 [Mycena albidolilacea]
MSIGYPSFPLTPNFFRLGAVIVENEVVLSAKPNAQQEVLSQFLLAYPTTYGIDLYSKILSSLYGLKWENNIVFHFHVVSLRGWVLDFACQPSDQAVTDTVTQILYHPCHFVTSANFAKPSLFSDHYVPSINHYVRSINYHIPRTVPSTYCYTMSVMLMYSNNMWVGNQVLEAQMWMQQGADGNAVDYAQNYWDEFKEDPEYIKAVLLADSDK